MNEIQYLRSLGYNPTIQKSEGLACPSLGQRESLMVWDSEMDGNVYVKGKNGEKVPDTSRSKFGTIL